MNSIGALWEHPKRHRIFNFHFNIIRTYSRKIYSSSSWIKRSLFHYDQNLQSRPTHPHENLGTGKICRSHFTDGKQKSGESFRKVFRARSFSGDADDASTQQALSLSRCYLPHDVQDGDWRRHVRASRFQASRCQRTTRTSDSVSRKIRFLDFSHSANTILPVSKAPYGQTK